MLETKHLQTIETKIVGLSKNTPCSVLFSKKYPHLHSVNSGIFSPKALPEAFCDSPILTIRGQQVMLDRDLAELYQVELRILNQAVKRNLDIFPSDFMFQLTEDEWDSLRSQIVILKNKRGQHRKYLPFVFTEIGCNSVSGVLNSAVAKSRSIFIHRAFVTMKKQIFSNPNYELLKEQVLRLQAETKLFNAKADAIQSEHKIDLNVQNMEINNLSEKMTELLKEFNKFRDASIIIQKDDGIGIG